MATETKIAGAGSSVNRGTDTAWSSPGLVTASDSYDAMCTTTATGDNTQHLRASSFGFGLPSGSQITGITVVYRRKAQYASSAVEVEVKIVDGSTQLGSNKASGTTWGQSYELHTVGGSADTWGITGGNLTTLSDNANSTIGVEIQAESNLFAPCDFNIDYVEMTLEYTAGGAGTYNGTTIAKGASAFWLLLCDASRVASDKLWTPERPLWTPRPAYSPEKLAKAD